MEDEGHGHLMLLFLGHEYGVLTFLEEVTVCRRHGDCEKEPM
jgi:hypothetical protein